MRNAALLVIFLSMVGIAAGYASAFSPGGAPPWAPWLFALCIAAVMVAILLLGVARKDKGIGLLGLVFVFCFVCVFGGFALALRAPAVTTTDRLWLGLPAGAAIILFVVGLLPMLILPIAYALTFDRTTLGAEELAQIRARLAELEK